MVLERRNGKTVIEPDNSEKLENPDEYEAEMEHFKSPQEMAKMFRVDGGV